MTEDHVFTEPPKPFPDLSRPYGYEAGEEPGAWHLTMLGWNPAGDDSQRGRMAIITDTEDQISGAVKVANDFFAAGDADSAITTINIWTMGLMFDGRFTPCGLDGRPMR